MLQEPIEENQIEQENDEFEILITSLIQDYDKIDNYKELKTYINGNKPSFNLLERSFTRAIKEENKQRFLRNLKTIIVNTQQINLQRVFIRVVLNYLKKIDDEIDKEFYKEQGIAEVWQKMHPQDIIEFRAQFKLDDQITPQDLLNFYHQLIKSKKYDEAYQFYAALKFELGEFNVLMNAMANNSDAGKAADYIKRQNLNPYDYPQILERLEKNCMRYMFKEYPWYKCEELLGSQKKLLSYLCEDLYHKGKRNEALSIIKRNNILNQIQKQDIKQLIEQDLNNGFEEIPNILYQKDDFIPSDSIINEGQQYIVVSDFGFTKDKIIFIDSLNQQFDEAALHIKQSKLIGLDTEQLTPFTKLDLNGIQTCLIQISTEQQAFIFDSLSLRKEEKFRQLMHFILDSNEILKVGLAIKDDLIIICQYLKLAPIIIRSVIDLGTAFKQLGNDGSKRSLAFISEYFFKRPLSKLDCCSDWTKRPLRQAQLHYAALDAIVCVFIYQKMFEQNQEILMAEKDVIQVNQ